MDEINNYWTIEFLLNVRSLKGKIELEDLRNLILKIPVEHKAINSQDALGYKLAWDYATSQWPKVHFLHPYISWSDTLMLKEGSQLKIYGGSVPLGAAIIHGSTVNYLRAIQKRASKSRVESIPDSAGDEVFFSVTPPASYAYGEDFAFEHLKKQIFPLSLAR